MSWPRAAYWLEVNGERTGCMAYRVLEFNQKMDAIKVEDRPFDHGSQLYKFVARWVPVNDIIWLNPEAHILLNGALKERVGCFAHGYGAKLKKEIAKEGGYKVE